MSADHAAATHKKCKSCHPEIAIFDSKAAAGVPRLHQVHSTESYTYLNSTLHLDTLAVVIFANLCDDLCLQQGRCSKTGFSEMAW